LLPEVNLGFRFMVTVSGVPLSAFTEVRLPTLTLETEEVKEGGLNTHSHKLPKTVNAGTVTFKHGIGRGSELLQWYLLTHRGLWSMAQRTVNVIVLDSTFFMPPVQIWTFWDAYPIKWVGPTLQAGQSAVLVEEIELAHSGYMVF
jgi:phage tail-like protein